MTCPYKIIHFYLDFIIMIYYLHCMDDSYEQFFLNPSHKKQIYYEALRMAFVEKKSDKEICDYFH